MEEKVLIKSEKYNVKKLFKILSLIGLTITIITFIRRFVVKVVDYIIGYNQWKEGTHSYGQGFIQPDSFDNSFSFAIANAWDNFIDGYWWMCLIPIASLTLIGGLIYLWLNSYELTITDKRVYGKVAFGKRVDLPVDSVSATATIGLFKGVSVSTSSGKISFLAIKNANEIYDVINNLLVDRQKEKTQNTGTTIVQNSDEADQLKKFKELLDSGVITQEEFDAKKKQLLGL